MKSLLGNGVTRAYRYDSLGRMVEERFSMGMVGGHRTTITYNEHGDRSEETLYEDDRTIEIQNDGSVVDNSETSTKRTCELRHAYRYDDRGNWTERTSLRRIQADQPYTLCSREQRIIFYR